MLCRTVSERPWVSMVRYKVARSTRDQNAVSSFSAWRRERPIAWLLRRMNGQEVTEAISSSATTTCTMGLASSTMLQTDKSLGIAPLREKILGDGTRLQRAGIEAGNPHGGIDQVLAAPLDRFPEMYCASRQTFKCSRDENFIMQHRGSQKIDGNIYHHELQFACRAQLLLVHPQRAQPIGPAALQELKVVGVVHHASRIGILPVNIERCGEAQRGRHLLAVPEQGQIQITLEHRGGETTMRIGSTRGDAATGGAHQKPLLHEKRLDYIFHGAPPLAHRSPHAFPPTPTP